MLNLRHDVRHEGPDPHMVEALVNAAASAMERASIPDITTATEVLSASFTLLDRTLRAVRHMEQPEDRAHNTKEIARVLQEMLVDFGSLPN